jgi:hypothetical protein
MEIQKVTKHQISTKKEPLELAYSTAYTKIKHIKNGDEIIQMLNYLYVLLNVKKDNQLNELEESVLNGFIVNNFKNFTIEEIKHAFRLAVAGELNVEMYQKLDSITFGKVLLNYKQFKNDKIREFNKTKKTEIAMVDKELIEKEFYENCILPYVEERKTMEEPKFDFATKAIFDHFYNKKMIKLSKKEIKQYKDEAEMYWQKHKQRKKDMGERVSLTEPLGWRSCVALYHKIDKAMELLNKENED